MDQFERTPDLLKRVEQKKARTLARVAEMKNHMEELIWEEEEDGIKLLTPEMLDILTQRALEWHDKNPLGEAMCKPVDDEYQAIIWVNQVAAILEKSERTAQRRLQIIRQLVGKGRTSPVTVKEFCHFEKHDEEWVRQRLKQIKPDYKD